MNNKKNTVIILAAGKGSRMDSSLPKVLHQINGVAMISKVINVAKKINPSNIIVIVGFKKELVISEINDDTILFVNQNEQKGTGHAILQCLPYIKDYIGNILILSGDVPLIKHNTLIDFIKSHNISNAKASLISTDLDNPSGYGRIIKNDNDELLNIVEHKDANRKQLLINEINSGIYLFESSVLTKKILLINNTNAQKEYYLTEIFDFIDPKDSTVKKITDSYEILGINTTDELKKLEKII